MKHLWIFLALGVALACGGTGGSNPGPGPGQSGAPLISNLHLNPSSVQQNDGGGTATVYLSFDFQDPDGDITTFRMFSGSESQDSQITGISGATSGSIDGSFSISTTQAGTFTFQIEVIDSKGHVSNALDGSFQVTPAPPSISSVNPLSVIVGGPAFTLTVNGTNFFPDSIVQWNGLQRPTTFLSDTQLQAAVTAEDIAIAGTANVSVENPVSEGGASYSFFFTISGIHTLIVDIPTNDIAWDPTHDVIYASLPSTAGSLANSIAVIDPATGNITSSVFAGSEPNRLAISDDGQFLYVGLDGAAAVQRFKLPSLTKDISIPLGSDPSFGAYSALDIQVAPQTPHTVAVSLGIQEGSVCQVLIFDDTTPRTNGAQGGFNRFDSLQWGSDTTELYGANSESTAFDYYILNVDASGVSQVVDLLRTFTSFINTIHFDKSTDLIYSDSGQVLTPTSGQPVGLFHSTGPMTPDSSQALAFFMDNNASFAASNITLESFNLNQFTAIGTASFHPIASSVFLSTPNRLLRWGNDGLAVGGRGNPIYLISGPFVSGQTSDSPSSALALSSISPMSAVAGGPSFTLNLSGSNFVQDFEVQWNGTSRPTTFISSTQLQAAITAQDIATAGSAQVTVSKPPGFSIATATFTIANLNTIVANVPANDIVWDATHNVIYASVPGTAGSKGNSIVVIDPATGNITTTVFAGSEPNRIAISDDAKFLYVGLDGANSVQRFTLPSLIKDISIPLGSDALFGPYTALDLQVAPANPHTIAISLGNKGISPAQGGVVIYDDTTPRTNGAQGGLNRFDSLQWGSDATALYGANSESTAFDYYILNVDASGVSQVVDLRDTFTSFTNMIHFDKSTNLIYADSGQVLTPASGQSFGTFQASGPMTPDSSQTMAFFLGGAFADFSLTLRSFNLTHFTPIDSVSLVPCYLPATAPKPNRLFRWGSNGLAFSGNENLVYIVSGPFVAGH